MFLQHEGVSVGTTSYQGGRESNEDVVYAEKAEERLLVGVVDGAGGHEDGEMASAFVASGFRDTFLDDPGNFDFERAKRLALQKFADYVQGRNFPKGVPFAVGTSVILRRYPLGQSGVIAHAGDTRFYLVRNREMNQITEDEVEYDEKGNRYVTNGFFAPGTIEGRETRVHIYGISMQKGDKCCIFSDGVTDVLGDDVILEIVLGEGNAEEKCDKIYHAAFEKGSDDNISAAILEFE